MNRDLRQMQPERPSAAQADVIVVLGCRVFASGQPSPPAKRRAARAARAYFEGAAPLIVASGGRRWGAQIEASVIRAELVAAGVPGEAIIEELWSLTTLENAIFSAAILRRIGASSVAIVTCPWHLPRAAQNFRGAGVMVTAALPTDPPRAGLLRRAWQQGHEIVCERLDARAMKRAGVLRESLEERERARRGR